MLANYDSLIESAGRSFGEEFLEEGSEGLARLVLQHFVLLRVLWLLGVQLLVEFLLAQTVDELLRPPHQIVYVFVLLKPLELHFSDFFVYLADGEHYVVECFPVEFELLLFLLLLQLQMVDVHCVVLQFLVQP